LFSWSDVTSFFGSWPAGRCPIQTLELSATHLADDGALGVLARILPALQELNVWCPGTCGPAPGPVQLRSLDTTLLIGHAGRTCIRWRRLSLTRLEQLGLGAVDDEDEEELAGHLRQLLAAHPALRIIKTDDDD
jgi:hypothetical protein